MTSIWYFLELPLATLEALAGFHSIQMRPTNSLPITIPIGAFISLGAICREAGAMCAFLRSSNGIATTLSH